MNRSIIIQAILDAKTPSRLQVIWERIKSLESITDDDKERLRIRLEARQKCLWFDQYNSKTTV